MACVGNCAFVAGTQGWFATRNRWFDLPPLLWVTFNLMRPDLVAKWLGVPHDQRYWTYLIGVGVFVGVYALQRWRATRNVA